MSGLEKKKMASMATMWKPRGTLGKSRSLGRSTKRAKIMTRTEKEIDGGYGQVDVWKRVLELSIWTSVRISDLDKDANAKEDRGDGHGRKEQFRGESTWSILATCSKYIVICFAS